MTAKEKARQLVDDYYNILPLDKYVITKDENLSWEYSGWQEAKKCALRVVVEILDELDLQNHLLRNYWYDVQYEIEKL